MLQVFATKERTKPDEGNTKHGFLYRINSENQLREKNVTDLCAYKEEKKKKRKLRNKMCCIVLYVLLSAFETILIY